MSSVAVLPDEEFYGFIPEIEVVPYPPNGSTEYHSYLWLVHSLGAKAGKLESVRPLLGFIATSLEANPSWEQRYGQIHKHYLTENNRKQLNYLLTLSGQDRWAIKYTRIMKRSSGVVKPIAPRVARGKTRPLVVQYQFER
ncbi:MAG: hypothetical protein MZV70_50260 [Desulfobacterales bacterium]|nr:hypothetical protein [Desulfobacterales bacterium]